MDFQKAIKITMSKKVFFRSQEKNDLKKLFSKTFSFNIDLLYD